jgi:hypothetical protein
MPNFIHKKVEGPIQMAVVLSAAAIFVAIIALWIGLENHGKAQ